MAMADGQVFDLVSKLGRFLQPENTFLNLAERIGHKKAPAKWPGQIFGW